MKTESWGLGSRSESASQGSEASVAGMYTNSCTPGSSPKVASQKLEHYYSCP